MYPSIYLPQSYHIHISLFMSIFAYIYLRELFSIYYYTELT